MNNISPLYRLKKVTLLIFLILFVNQLFAQTNPPDTADYPYYQEMWRDPNANFHATVRAFDKYWEGKEITKGCGYKQFKRWQAFYETRVGANGKLPAPDAVFKAMQKKKSLTPQLRNSTLDFDDWRELGPVSVPYNANPIQPNGIGRISTIAFHPTDPNTLFAGTPQGGLWKSTNNGETWSSQTDDLPTLGVQSILIHPTNPNIMYIGTGDDDAKHSPGLGLFKSTDGGIHGRLF